MTRFKLATLASAATLVGAIAVPAHAATRVVEFNVLNATATLPTAFALGDTLILDTVATQETGALSQSITFTLAAGVTGLTGHAAWEVSTAAGPGPRLTGVDINILDSLNNPVITDGGVSVANGFATSSLAGAIGPGTYRLVATGTGVRDSVLDVSISMVPEPRTYGLMLAGLGVVGLLARRRRNS